MQLYQELSFLAVRWLVGRSVCLILGLKERILMACFSLEVMLSSFFQAAVVHKSLALYISVSKLSNVLSLFTFLPSLYFSLSIYTSIYPYIYLFICVSIYIYPSIYLKPHIAGPLARHLSNNVLKEVKLVELMEQINLRAGKNIQRKTG